MKDGSLQLQLPPQLGGVAEVSVVSDGHVPLHMVDLNGLAVAAICGPGSAVPHMAHRHGSLGKSGQLLLRKDLAQQPQILS